MSDILIKNFEMPKECIERQGYFDYVYCPMFGRCSGRKPKSKECMLVELPPHDDLIDRKEIHDYYIERMENPDKYHIPPIHEDIRSMILNGVNDAPTVLEANNGSDN